MKQKTLEFLEAHKSDTPSKWREEAEWMNMPMTSSLLFADGVLTVS